MIGKQCVSIRHVQRPAVLVSSCIDISLTSQLHAFKKNETRYPRSRIVHDFAERSGFKAFDGRLHEMARGFRICDLLVLPRQLPCDILNPEMPFISKPVLLTRSGAEVKSQKAAIAQTRPLGALPKEWLEILVDVQTNCFHKRSVEQCQSPLYNLFDGFQTRARDFVVQSSPFIETEISPQLSFKLTDRLGKLPVLFSVAHCGPEEAGNVDSDSIFL